MRNTLNAAGSAAIVALLVGCAAQPPTPAPSVAPATMAASPAASGSGGVDGTYYGPSGGVSGNSGCGTTRFNFPIRVTGGVASMSSVINGTLEGLVSPDGSLSIEKGRALLRGQFAGGKFNGSYSTGRCAFMLTYAKR